MSKIPLGMLARVCKVRRILRDRAAHAAVSAGEAAEQMSHAAKEREAERGAQLDTAADRFLDMERAVDLLCFDSERLFLERLALEAEDAARRAQKQRDELSEIARQKGQRLASAERALDLAAQHRAEHQSTEERQMQDDLTSARGRRDS